MIVLVFNAGSSSLKFALFHVAEAPELLFVGEAEDIGEPQGHFSAKGADGAVMASLNEPISSGKDAAARAIALLRQFHLPSPDAIGHRIVHGGTELSDHVLIDDTVVAKLESAAAFAPLHVPAALEILRVSRLHFPDVPQVACLDTAFHTGMPDVARRFPLPEEFAKHGIRRYGFHGLSCESIMRRLAPKIPSRIVIAHLGSGASVTAVLHGRSIDTSMGLTPMGGIMMATRSGDLDPGLLIYLAREEGYTPASLETLLDRGSGLAGISGLSGDLRVLRRAPENEQARLAIDMFCYSARKDIAAMAAALEGLDLLVFTGGIGEHDGEICDRICAGMEWLGSFAVHAMAPLEEEQIAIHASHLVARRNDALRVPGDDE